MSTKRFRLAKLCAPMTLAALLFAGCGSDKAASDATETPTTDDAKAQALAEYCAQPDSVRKPDLETAEGIKQKLKNLQQVQSAVPADLVDDFNAAIPLLEAIELTFIANGDGAPSLDDATSPYQIFLAEHPEAKAANEAISGWLGDACGGGGETPGRNGGESTASADQAKADYCAQLAADGTPDLESADGLSAALNRLSLLQPAVPADLATDFSTTLALFTAKAASFTQFGDNPDALTADGSPYATFIDQNPDAKGSVSRITEWAAGVCG